MTTEEAIQILNLYDLGNMFLDIDGNPIGYEKMSSACDMAVDALKNQNAEKMIDYKKAFEIACELLNDSWLYGWDRDKIFEQMMADDHPFRGSGLFWLIYRN